MAQATLQPGMDLYKEAYEAWIIAGSPRTFDYRGVKYMADGSGQTFTPVVAPPQQDLYKSTSIRGGGRR